MPNTIYNPKYRKLCKLLKDSRKAQGLTIRDLAAKMGSHPNYVHNVESGHRRLDVLEFVGYCTVLGLDPKETLQLLY